MNSESEHGCPIITPVYAELAPNIYRATQKKRKDKLDMAELSDRIRSFVDWPKQMAQSPRELSEAGFFYWGENY